MDASLLIDAIVRQTTVLVAGLATRAGGRASLANIANQVFMDLTGELKRQGLGNKVIADMFGMALRSYHGKVARLSESRTEQGRSLWEAVLEHLRRQPNATGILSLMAHFRYDDEILVRGVVHDLVRSGLVDRSGKGEDVALRALDEADVLSEQADPAAQTASLVMVAIDANGPVTRDRLLAIVPMQESMLEDAIATLLGDDRISAEEMDGDSLYRTGDILIPHGDPNGWEAAVFDHYQALVTALCVKLRQGTTLARADDATGGSTYSYRLWEGHPMEAEARSLLAKLREQAVDLRKRVESHNRKHEMPPGKNELRVVAYVGQSVVGDTGE